MKYLIFSIILAGCGTQDPANKGESPFVSEETKAITPEIKEEITANNPPMAMTVSGEKPTCGPENENQLIYHVEDELFYSCKGNDWSVIDLKGKDGAKGEDGVDGADGQLIINSWFSSKNAKFCLVGDELSATTYCSNSASLVLYSNGYAQLSMGGNQIPFSVVNKVENNKVIFFVRINEDVLTKFTIIFSDDMKEVSDFLWQSKLNGQVINAVYRGVLYNDDIIDNAISDLSFPAIP